MVGFLKTACKKIPRRSIEKNNLERFRNYVCSPFVTIGQYVADIVSLWKKTKGAPISEYVVMQKFIEELPYEWQGWSRDRLEAITAECGWEYMREASFSHFVAMILTRWLFHNSLPWGPQPIQDTHLCVAHRLHLPLIIRSPRMDRPQAPQD